MVLVPQPTIAVFTHAKVPQWTQLFSRRQDWRLVYADDLSVICLRENFATEVPALVDPTLEPAARVGLRGREKSTTEPVHLFFNLRGVFFDLGMLRWSERCDRRFLEHGPDLAAQQRMRQLDGCDRIRASPGRCRAPLQTRTGAAGGARSCSTLAPTYFTSIIFMVSEKV